MGKKGKRSRKTTDTNFKGTISIVTPTVKKRCKCLNILAKYCISKQTFVSEISQWVIVSGDISWSENEFNEFIKEIEKQIPENIKIDGYYVNENSAKENNWPIVDDYEAIGYLRNITNIVSTGDYIVCMDDDDYYPKERVEHAVLSLIKSNSELAGCSGHIIYETDINSLFQFKPFGPNHTVNNSLAYKRSYLESGASYDSSKRHAEEKSFLKDYSIPTFQLDPMRTVVQMVHDDNTYNKRHLFIHSSFSKNPNIKKINFSPSKMIPNEVLDAYSNELNNKCSLKSKYDIVYYTGLGAPNWSPYDEKLGGSEQAVYHLAKEWVKLGYSVAVYGDFDENVVLKTRDDIINGDYLNFKDFKCSVEYENLILWRLYGSHPLLSWPIKAKKIFIDLHDSIRLNDSFIDNIDKVSHIMVKSNFHANVICNYYKGENLRDKMLIVQNGVRVSEFTPKGAIERDPYRFCWCSCYKRGLDFTLAYMWPIIKHYEPKASFHIYYGMDGIGNSPREVRFKEQMGRLLSQAGVVDHGRQNMSEIIKEKHKSTFHLYYSKTAAETDCISIRESNCAGCIPIISQYNVFKERHGIQLPGDPTNQEDNRKVAAYILELLKKPDDIKNICDDITGKEKSWSDVSKEWVFNKSEKVLIKEKTIVEETIDTDVESSVNTVVEEKIDTEVDASADTEVKKTDDTTAKNSSVEELSVSVDLYSDSITNSKLEKSVFVKNEVSKFIDSPPSC